MTDKTKSRVTYDKPIIKKLTAEKLKQFRGDIFQHNGQHVDLTRRGIETIVSLEGLENVTKLDLSHNKLTKLSQLKSLTHLTMLKVTDNKLNGDGLAEIQHLNKLVILNAAENNVTRIQFEVLRNVRSLKALVLNNNSIHTLEWIPKLPELNSLILSHNRITQIPQRVVDGLPSLKKISISHNLLEDIPNLSHLSEITELRLSHNQITKIPSSLAQLKALKVLELSHNLIDSWSGLEELSSLENLRQLNLIGNPIVGKKLEANAVSAERDGESSDQDDDTYDGTASDCDKGQKKKMKCEKSSISEAQKKKIKEAKRLDAKHKQYNFKMKRLFPNLVVRDATRVLEKRVHGYVAAPKDEKKKTDVRHIKLIPANEEIKNTLGKQKRDEFKKANVVATVCAEDGEAVEKLSNKDHKKHKMTASSLVQVAVDDRQAEKNSTHTTEQLKFNTRVPIDIEHRGSVSRVGAASGKMGVKEKKRKRQDQKKQPVDLDSGVVAVKQFKKARTSKSEHPNPVYMMQINLTPNIGFGGSSAWD
ncbi:hypothetical protein PsorP6_017869 [Peronosclerospora sorghi]|uniref:Uncharacterized protein n=1 Tax=Peronosclerospora sorghi TaxID=230839 RepID=A0ACC0WE30_9STRA|nr:hypothetical protein PsorP6_017869 [Peronosclerospora sorghi]